MSPQLGHQSESGHLQAPRALIHERSGKVALFLAFGKLKLFKTNVDEQTRGQVSSRAV
jgi:hypothetical protein